MGRNHLKEPKSIDGGRLEEGVWVSHLRSRAVRRRKVRQSTSPQGRISITGMHGPESKAGAGIFGAHSLSRKANEGNCDSRQHNLWRLHQRERGGLGACDPKRGPETPDRSG